MLESRNDVSLNSLSYVMKQQSLVVSNRALSWDLYDLHVHEFYINLIKLAWYKYTLMSSNTMLLLEHSQ